MSWTEIGVGCFARRYESFDVTIGVVVGTNGLLVVDTRSGPYEADELLSDLRELSPLPVRWVVDTHWHFDHSFGNARFDQAEVYGHETVPAMLAEHAEAERAGLAERSEEWARQMAELVIVPPTRTFGSVAAIDLGDRGVELVHGGRGHTDGDVVVRVPDADVVFMGDLIEQSGPPSYGSDSFPLDWPTTVELLSGLVRPSTTVVPGHGDPVDEAFLARQHGELVAVSELIREQYASGVEVERALETGGTRWPYPAERLGEAVRRGYAQLREAGAGPDRKHLPLLPS